jgi:hypothetical protein
MLRGTAMVFGKKSKGYSGLEEKSKEQQEFDTEI